MRRRFLAAEEVFLLSFVEFPFVFFLRCFSFPARSDRTCDLNANWARDLVLTPRDLRVDIAESGGRNFISGSGVFLFITHCLPSLSYCIKFRYFWKIFWEWWGRTDWNGGFYCVLNDGVWSELDDRSDGIKVPFINIDFTWVSIKSEKFVQILICDVIFLHSTSARTYIISGIPNIIFKCFYSLIFQTQLPLYTFIF